MMEFYPQIKWVHIAAVLCSGTVFLARGWLVLLGRGALARITPLRYLSFTIDTVLLTAALMLFTILPSAYFANGWLTTKLVLLPVYIVLGILAFRPATSPRRRVILFVSAVLVYAFMISIALAHHPLGVLHLGFG